MLRTQSRPQNEMAYGSCQLPVAIVWTRVVPQTYRDAWKGSSHSECECYIVVKLFEKTLD